MDLLETVLARHSIRAFIDQPIAGELLERILTDASRAPSAINMQPWEVHMVVGEERKRLSRRLLRAFKERRITCGPGATKVIPDRFMARASEAAQAMNPLLERMGTDLSTYVNEGSLNFYGAPVVALIFLDNAFPPERAVDIGSFMAYLVIAAAGHGLGSCPIGLITAYEDEIKDHLNIPETKKLVISVALGLPDQSAAINEFRSSRVGLKEFVRWVE